MCSKHEKCSFLLVIKRYEKSIIDGLMELIHILYHIIIRYLNNRKK